MNFPTQISGPVSAYVFVWQDNNGKAAVQFELFGDIHHSRTCSCKTCNRNCTSIVKYIGDVLKEATTTKKETDVFIEMEYDSADYSNESNVDIMGQVISTHGPKSKFVLGFSRVHYTDLRLMGLLGGMAEGDDDMEKAIMTDLPDWTSAVKTLFFLFLDSKHFPSDVKKRLPHVYAIMMSTYGNSWWEDETSTTDNKIISKIKKQQTTSMMKTYRKELENSITNKSYFKNDEEVVKDDFDLKGSQVGERIVTLIGSGLFELYVLGRAFKTHRSRIVLYVGNAHIKHIISSFIPIIKKKNAYFLNPVNHPPTQCKQGISRCLSF